MSWRVGSCELGTAEVTAKVGWVAGSELEKELRGSFVVPFSADGAASATLPTENEKEVRPDPLHTAVKPYIGGFRHSKPYPIRHVRTLSILGFCPHGI